MRSGDFIAEEYNGAGDSDVKAENLRVQKILYEPRNKGEETPVVLIHVYTPIDNYYDQTIYKLIVCVYM